MTNWAEDDQPKIPEGTQRVKIIKVRHERKGKGMFRTRSGDRQVMLILVDGNGGEAVTMLTLSPSATFFTKKAIKACYPAEEVKALTIDIADIGDEETADLLFLNREAFIRIEWDDEGRSSIEWKPWTEALPRTKLHGSLTQQRSDANEPTKPAPSGGAALEMDVPFSP